MIPHFLVIGTQKSGTTWLDRNLRTHPEVWLPLEKELHYFNLPRKIPFIYLLFSNNAEVRRWVFKRMQRAYQKAKADPKTSGWYLHYYLLARTDWWYKSLFKPEKGQLAGEATPHYAVMSDRKIARIYALNPDMKMVYLIRNPIDRMWSHAAMQFSKKYNHQGIGTIDTQSILNFLLKPNHLAHARYYENLIRWEKHFPKNQIFIGFFDEITEDPNRLLSATFQFLGVTNSAEYISERAKEKIYSGDYHTIPKDIACVLAKIFIDDLEKLHHHLQSPYTAKWLAQCHALLED